MTDNVINNEDHRHGLQAVFRNAIAYVSVWKTPYDLQQIILKIELMNISKTWIKIECRCLH